MSKVLEKIVAAQLFDYLNRKNLFEQFQSGFTVIGMKGTARFQFVHVNEEASSHTRVSYGVPQGSVFGPILFSYTLSEKFSQN